MYYLVIARWTKMTATDHNFSKTLFNDNERLTISYWDVNCTLIKKICNVTLKIVIKRIFGTKKKSNLFMQRWQQHGNIYNLNVSMWFCLNFWQVFFLKKEFSLHFYGIQEIGLEIFICFEYMFWCSRWLSAHYSWLLIFCYSLLKEICLSFQGNVLHEIKWILNIVDLSK